MGNTNIFIPYEDLNKLQRDSANLESIISLLNTEFPDDTCQLIAIKSILGLIKEEEEPTGPVDPIDPDPSDPVDPGTTDPTDPTDPPSGSDPGSSDPTP